MSKRIFSLVKGGLFLTMLIALTMCAVACNTPSKKPEEPKTSAIRFVKDGNVEVEMYKSKIIQIINENPANTITWSVQDASVVELETEIYADGLSAKVTGLKVGATQVTVSDGKDNISVTVNVVTPKYPPTIVVEDKIVAFTGQTYDLLPTLAYDNKTVEDITFEYVSSNENILQTSADGKITPISFGNAVVTIKANFMGDEVVKDVAVTVIEKPAPVNNKIGYFDNEYGIYQLSSNSAQLSFSESVAYDNESGSLEILVTQEDGVFKGTFESLIQKDISNTAYVLFRVYNPNEFAIVVEFDEGIGSTECAANQWTTIICKTSDIQKSEGLNNQTADITGLTLVAYAQDGSASLKDGKLYVSAMFAEEKVDGKIGYFDTDFGATQLTAAIDANIEYSTQVKFGDEKGSTKFTWKAATPANGESIYVTDLIQKDVSNYDYLVFRIYNPNEFDIIFKFYIWFGWTRCTANAWTEVKVAVEDILSDNTGEGNPNITSLEDITRLTLLFDGGDQLIDKSIYLSAMMAIEAPAIEDKVEVVEGKIGYFDNPYGAMQFTTESSVATLSYSTEIKYGDEAGSLAITFNSNGGVFGYLTTLIEKDISKYDYIEFYIYLPCAASFRFDNDEGWITNMSIDTVNQWVQYKMDIDGKMDTITGLINSTSDITGLTFRFTGWGNDLTGQTIYISAMYGRNNVEVGGGDDAEDLEGTKLINFDQSDVAGYGGDKIYGTTASKEYSTEIKYGNEAGSTKIVALAGNNTILYSVGCFAEDNVTKYDYIIFRVYNANDYVIKFEFGWQPWVVCAIGEWTDIKINVADLPNDGSDGSQTKINWVAFKAAEETTGASREGLTIHLSAVYGVVEEVVGGGVEELEGTKLINFDQSDVAGYGGDKIYGAFASKEYSTEVKYGNEAGSTKIVAMAGNNGILYDVGCFAENDITAYDYIILRVYNANSYAIKFQIGWQTPVVCASNEWTEIKINVADLPNDGSIGSQTNINWVAFKAVEDSTNTSREALTIYLSALYGCNNSEN